MANLSRRRALWILAAITALGGAFRFYNLAWGAPYYHFHMDEHFVLGPADVLRRDVRAAAMGSKFFMYSPLMMYLTNFVRWVYEMLSHPLDLTVPRDQVTYMVLGRAIAATFGTATILLAYAIAAKISGRVAGLLAAFFLACAVLHLRDSHFATTDMPMTFFSILAIWWSLRIVERGDLGSLIGAGAAVGAAVASKYTGVIALGVVGVAYFLSPRRPKGFDRIGPWAVWALRGMIPIAVAVVTFFILDPLVLQFPDKFLSDFKEQVTDPLLGVTKPIIFAHFADLTTPRLFWFTNNLWWSLGPLLEMLGLAGVIWLLVRWDTRAGVVAAFPIIYFAVAGRTVAPMIRYSNPLVPALAVAAGILAADWLARTGVRGSEFGVRGSWFGVRGSRFGVLGSHVLAVVVIGATVLTTGLYAFAYMNIFRQPDSRVEASKWLVENVPPGSKILVEPSQNTPPMGSYYTATNFHDNYVLWGGRSRREAERERNDYYHLYTLDTYVYLYADRYDDEEKRGYIASRLAQVDWIVMDDTYLQWYDHLTGPRFGEGWGPASLNAVVNQHYQDLFSGKLGFALVKTFKSYPKLFGWTINDDSAEFTFRLFDHPRVFVFRRFAPSPGAQP